MREGHDIRTTNAGCKISITCTVLHPALSLKMGFSLADRLPDYSPEKFMDAPPVYSANDALAEFNALTPAQKSKLATGMAVAASSDEADAQFKAASRTAAGAVYTIDTLFINMLMQLVMLEDAYEFVATNVLLRSVRMVLACDIVPDCSNGVEQEFITAVTGSKKLAINIAEYAESEIPFRFLPGIEGDPCL